MSPDFEPQPPTQPQPEPFWSWFDFAVFAGAVLPCTLLGYGIVKGLQWALHWTPPSEALIPLVAQTLGYLLLFGVLSLMFRLYERPFWRSLGFTTLPLPAWWIVTAGLATALSVSLLGNLIGTPNTENDITKLMKDPLSLALMAVFGIFIAPLCEELVFRGFLQPLLTRSFGPAAGILGAALPFGVLHYREYGNSWKHALLISFAGAAFGLMRHATRSTFASTLMHAAYNSLFFVAFFAAKRYT
jgi:membrane protease YdiL (CAAX protease family)